MSAAGPSQGANCAPSGGSVAAPAASVGAEMSAAGPSQGANYAPLYACRVSTHRVVAVVAYPAEVLRVRAQPDPPQSFELVPKQLGVHVLAFVAKPEQLPERTSHVARRGYDERYS